jgi:hypothetical protein
MRVPTLLFLGCLLVLPARWAPAEEPDDEMDDRTYRQEITRQQLEALHDLENAETDEEADEAKQRFDDASGLEVQRRRSDIDDLIERGGSLPPSPRPGPPHP